MNRYCIPLAAALLIAIAGEAHAQRVPNYVRTPTISPYINLFRGNTGGINSYFTFIRPIQNQLRFNEMQMVRNREFDRQIQFNQRVLPLQILDAQNQLLQQGMLRPGSPVVGQPRAAASFFNYSHYYGVPVSGGVVGGSLR